MAAKLRGSYLYFFLGFGTIVVIFTLGSQRPAVTEGSLEGNITQIDATSFRSFINDSDSDGSNSSTISVRDIVNCSDRVLKKNVFQRGNFVVFQNFIVADKQFGCHESITLTSPGDYRFLDNIVPLVDRWRGPVSVALYAPGSDFFTTLQCIAYLRTCKSPLVREYATFHLFFENGHFPKKSVWEE